jgi:hypothetical protein
MPMIISIDTIFTKVKVESRDEATLLIGRIIEWAAQQGSKVYDEIRQEFLDEWEGAEDIARTNDKNKKRKEKERYEMMAKIEEARDTASDIESILDQILSKWPE